MDIHPTLMTKTGFCWWVGLTTSNMGSWTFPLKRFLFCLSHWRAVCVSRWRPRSFSSLMFIKLFKSLIFFCKPNNDKGTLRDDVMGTGWSVFEGLTSVLSEDVVLLPVLVGLLSIDLGSLDLVAPQLRVHLIDPGSHIRQILDFGQFCPLSRDGLSGGGDPFLIVNVFHLLQPKGLVNVFNLQRTTRLRLNGKHYCFNKSGLWIFEKTHFLYHILKSRVTSFSFRSSRSCFCLLFRVASLMAAVWRKAHSGQYDTCTYGTHIYSAHI